MSVCVQREANTRTGCHVQDVYRERPPQKSGGIFRPHGGSANVGGVRREKTWAGGVLERAVVQVRARQAEAGASGPLRHSRLCLMGAGVDGTITLLRLAQGSLHTGRGVPRGHQGSRGQWPGDGSLGPLLQI